MRASTLFLALTALAASASSSHAQGPGRRMVRAQSSYRSTPVVTYAQSLVHQRALYRARQRMARLGVRRWMNISVARPIDRGGFGMNAFHGHAPTATVGRIGSPYMRITWSDVR